MRRKAADSAVTTDERDAYEAKAKELENKYKDELENDQIRFNNGKPFTFIIFTGPVPPSHWPSHWEDIVEDMFKWAPEE